MITKTFKYKGQMINYFNKVKDNPKIDCVYCGFFCDLGGWAIMYAYKK